MLSKDKLVKIASIIESTLPLIEKLEKDRPIRANAQSIMYETGLNILVRGTQLNGVLNKQKRFMSAKMMRSAKNLTKDFEDFGLNAYADFFERNLDRINNINGPSKLAPHKETVLALIKDDIEDFLLYTESFYQNLMTDIFNVGRQHQEITALKKEGEVRIKKYMIYSLDENKKFEKLNNLMQTELTLLLGLLNEKLNRTVERNFKKISYKKDILDHMAKVYSKFSYKIEDIYRKHCWKAYQCGNLHQLQRDGVRMVAWKTGHHVDDCLHCRAFETGDDILHDAYGIPLEHHRNIDTVRYKLADIVALSEFDSPMYFCHEDCRCFFVGADN